MLEHLLALALLGEEAAPAAPALPSEQTAPAPAPENAAAAPPRARRCETRNVTASRVRRETVCTEASTTRNARQAIEDALRHGGPGTPDPGGS